jgi:hypothetical protein
LRGRNEYRLSDFTACLDLEFISGIRAPVSLDSVNDQHHSSPS